MESLRERVLLVTDDHALCKSVTDHLSMMGYSVLIVSDGEAAIVTSKKENLSLVICATRCSEIH